MAISPTKKMIATMRSSYSNSNLNSFMSDLLIGKGGLLDLKSTIQIKKADKWDGKDAPKIEEEDLSMYDDEPSSSAHDEL